MTGCQLDPLEATPGVFEQARQRRQEAEALCAELMALPPERWRRKARRASFQGTEIVKLLLEESQSRQLADPKTGRELAVVAARLATHPAAKAKAFCLEVNALRLAGQRTRALQRLRRPPAFNLAEDRARYYRTAALVLWEEGLGVVAVDKLRKAARLYESVGLIEHEGTCLALLGLVHLEQGETAKALSPLRRGWAAIHRRRRPLLALRVALGLARALAMDDEGNGARAVLVEVWQLYGAVLHDPGELLRVQWGEALVLARLGEVEVAASILAALFQELLRSEAKTEAVLLALDLAAVLDDGGRRAEIAAVAEQLAAGLGEVPPEVGLILGLRRGSAGRELAEGLEASVRRTFRMAGDRIKPFPFA